MKLLKIQVSIDRSEKFTGLIFKFGDQLESGKGWKRRRPVLLRRPVSPKEKILILDTEWT